jgi:hypothetical protein
MMMDAIMEGLHRALNPIEGLDIASFDEKGRVGRYALGHVDGWSVIIDTRLGVFGVLAYSDEYFWLKDGGLPFDAEEAADLFRRDVTAILADPSLPEPYSFVCGEDEPPVWSEKSLRHLREEAP